MSEANLIFRINNPSSIQYTISPEIEGLYKGRLQTGIFLIEVILVHWKWSPDSMRYSYRRVGPLVSGVNAAQFAQTSQLSLYCFGFPL